MSSERRQPRDWLVDPDTFGDYPVGTFQQNVAHTAEDRARLAAAKVQDRFAWEVKKHIGGSSARHRRLARALGYDKPDTVRAITRGETHLGLSTMFEIADILGIPLQVVVDDRSLP